MIKIDCDKMNNKIRDQDLLCHEIFVDNRDLLCNKIIMLDDMINQSCLIINHTIVPQVSTPR